MGLTMEDDHLLKIKKLDCIYLALVGIDNSDWLEDVNWDSYKTHNSQ